MTQPDLFHPDLKEWADEQLKQLNLRPGDDAYDGARQAAEQGWSADRIRALIWPLGNAG